MTEYTFPFHTCETPNKIGVAQPYSTFVNVVNCAIILYFLLQTTKTYTFLLLLAIFCFEAFHTFSHSIHIAGSIQINITHMLTYFINIAFFYAFYSYTHSLPSTRFLVYMLVLVCLDIYAFSYLSIVFYIASQATIAISLLVYYYPLLPKMIQKKIYQIIFLIGVIILLFLNETQNCENMLAFYPHFPYHVLIEIAGIFLFYILCSTFYKL